METEITIVVDNGDYETTQTFGRKPEKVELFVGKRQRLPLRDQLFDHEWEALCELKGILNKIRFTFMPNLFITVIARHPKICRFYSDEFLCACLFSRKMDIERVNVLLIANWKWRKENKLIKIPTLSEINLEIFHTFFGIPGARTEDGCGLLYASVNAQHTAGQEPWTVESVTKAATFFNFVGVFLEGMDYVRNGICIAMDLYNFGWAHWDYGFWSGMGGMWTDTFPMLMKRIAIFNPPMILSGLLKLASLFVKKKIMSRIAVLDSSDKEEVLGHLDASESQVSKEFGGKIEYTWEKYEIELREFCEEHEERLTWLPAKDKKGKFLTTDSLASSSEFSGSYYSEASISESDPLASPRKVGNKKSSKTLNLSFTGKKGKSKGSNQSNQSSNEKERSGKERSSTEK
jgi:hypothetical protein